MKRLKVPAFDDSEIYFACAAAIPGVQAAAAYTAASSAMMLQSIEYRVRAASNALHTFQASDSGNDQQVVAGGLTKGDLKKLYDRGMLKGADGRTYYDKLLASAPLGKCPYCQFGHAETLDHFLSKARYPSFAVLPSNLIPSCMRCNKGKGGGVVTPEMEMSHPYFELTHIEQDVWLSAEVAETSPVTATYAITTPSHWPIDLARRVKNYFDEFDLSVRYAVEAASELVSVSAYLGALPSADVRLDHLQRVATEERGLYKNGWKTALYAALSTSNWYCEIGYAGVGVT